MDPLEGSSTSLLPSVPARDDRRVAVHVLVSLCYGMIVTRV